MMDGRPLIWGDVILIWGDELTIFTRNLPLIFDVKTMGKSQFFLTHLALN
jgi:hypothetical protein